MAKDKKKDEKKASKKGPSGALIFLGAMALLGGVFALLVFLEVFILRKKPEFDPDTNPPLSAAACGSYSYTPVIKGGLQKKLSFSMTTSPSASWLSVDSTTGEVKSSNIPFDAQNITVTLKVTEDSKREENTATQIFTISITRKSADATWDPDTKSAGITIDDNLITKPRNTSPGWVYADLVPQKGCYIDFDLKGIDFSLPHAPFFFGIYPSKDATGNEVGFNGGSQGFDVRFEVFANNTANIRVSSSKSVSSQANVESSEALVENPFRMLIVDSKIISFQLPSERFVYDPPIELDSNQDFYIGVRRSNSTQNGEIRVRVRYEYCD